MPLPSREAFAENLDRIMREKGVKNATLAKHLQVSRATIGRWREGEAEPGFEEKDRISTFLGVPVSAFYADPTDSRSMGLDLQRALRMVSEAIRRLDE